MKKIIIVLSCVLVLLSCGNNVKSSQTSCQRIINGTEKELYHEVQTEEGTKGMFLNGLDSVEITFHRERDVNIPFWASTIHLAQIKVEKESIFNLTDTCSYTYNLGYSSYPLRWETVADSIFVRQHSFYFGEGSTEINSIEITTKHVTDSLIDVMQKDYSMLDRFKDYYGR